MLRVSRQACYQAVKRLHRRKAREFEVLKAVIRYRSELPQTGTRKLWKHLKASMAIGRDHLFRLLRAHGLLLPAKRRKPPQGYSMGAGPYPNRTHGLHPERTHQVWISDITYLRLGDRFYYLTLVADAFSRRILGYTLGMRADANMIMRAVEKSLCYKPKGQRVILHFDQGPQYHSKQLLKQLSDAFILPSMSRRAKPQDNARMERIMGILKYEFDLKRVFYNELYMKETVDHAIWQYNHRRLHAALGYRVPAQIAPHPHSRVNVI